MTSLTGPRQSTQQPTPTAPAREARPQTIDLRDSPTTTARMQMPTRRTVRTRSGSRYEILGREVRKLEPYGGSTDYILIDMRGDRLRYTDGERLYISSPVVGTRTDPS